MRELVAGFVTFATGVGVLAFAIRRGGQAVNGVFWVAVGIEVAIIASIFLDYGYSWVDVRAVNMALTGNVWVASPHALAALALLALVAWGRQAIPTATGVVALQAASFPVALELVGQDQDMSFLSAAPLASEYLSVLAVFMFIPAACTVIPSPASKWHKVAFGPRSALIDAIRSLEELGLTVRPPSDVLESGSACGTLTGTMVRITTRPSLWPPRYGLLIEVSGARSVPAAPHFAPIESLSSEGGVFRYSGLTERSFSITREALQSFLRESALGCDSEYIA